VKRDMELPIERHVRAIFISDIHLGTAGCQASALLDFLKQYRCDYIYLVGDIVDGWQLRKRWFWPQVHNDVVQKLLRAARKGTRVIYVPGNHDEFARQFTGHHFATTSMPSCNARSGSRTWATRSTSSPSSSIATSIECAATSACRTGRCRSTSSTRSRRP
jgi:predicted MPP superfamily phosphohydrolase